MRNSFILMKKLTAEQGNKCYYCNCKMNHFGAQPKKRNATIEHLQRKCNGGTYSRDNIVIACYECNSHRGDYSSEMWKKIYHNIILLREKKRIEIGKVKKAISKGMELYPNTTPSKEKQHSPLVKWLSFVIKNKHIPRIEIRYKVLMDRIVLINHINGGEGYEPTNNCFH